MFTFNFSQPGIEFCVTSSLCLKVGSSCCAKGFHKACHAGCSRSGSDTAQESPAMRCAFQVDHIGTFHELKWIDRELRSGILKILQKRQFETKSVSKQGGKMLS